MSDGAYWIAFGDVHGQTANMARLPGVEGAAGIIITGDLTLAGGVAEAAPVIEAARELNPVIFAQIGNMDYESVTAYLEEEGANLHRRVVPLDATHAPGVVLAGVGGSTPTPFNTPSEYGEHLVAAWLDELAEEAAKAAGFRHMILVSHTPPKDTATDTVGGGVHVGSTAVRTFIERYQPALCLTGHIHESAGVERLGETLVLNPGMLADGGYARISLDGAGRPTAALLRI